MPTHYQLLDVAQDADQATIRAAYKALIKQHHPDAAGGDAEMAARLNEAYRALRDKQRRAAYDRAIAVGGGRARAHRPAYTPGPQFDYFRSGMATAAADEGRFSASRGMEPGQDGYLGQKTGWRNGLLLLAIICAIIPFALVLWKKLQAPSPPAEGTAVSAPILPQTPATRPAPDDAARGPLVGSERPPTGLMSQVGREGRSAPFEVTGPAGADYFLKLIDETTGQTAISLYVRGGERFTTTVPLGRYRLRSAWGYQWLGTRAFFGPATQFAEANDIYDFGVEEGRIRGFTVALVRLADGNPQGRPIRRDEF